MTETPEMTSDTTTQGTVATLPGAAGQRFAEHVAARYKSGGEWQELSFAQVKDAVDEIALGLVALGIAAGDRVAILADTRLEWTLTSYAISAAGAVVVPVYPTNSPKECAWVLGNSGASAVFCESEAQRAKIDQVRDELPDLKATIGIEEGAGESSLEQLRERGRDGDRSELEARQAAVVREDPYTIIYTSGTTGPPKGVVLTHGNAMSVGEMVQELDFISPGERTYLFLPLAHAFALTAQLASFELGTTIIFYGGDSKKILEELVETSPTYLPSVPRIFEKLYTAAMKLQEQGDEREQARFAQAIELGVEVRRRQQHGESVSDEMQAAFDQADERLFARVRSLFGGEIRQAVRRRDPSSRNRGGADRGRHPRVLLRLWRARDGGLGHVRDDRGRHGGDPRTLRSSGPSGGRCRGWKPGSPRRTARSCSVAPTSFASIGTTPTPPPKPWSTVGCTPATSVRSTTRVT
jgi:long-chain acyl-CoA synthetase